MSERPEKRKQGILDRLNSEVGVIADMTCQRIMGVYCRYPLKGWIFFVYPRPKDSKASFYPSIFKGPSPQVNEFEKLTEKIGGP